jgi:hypothetical protein
LTHLGFTFLFFLIILILRAISDGAVISLIFKIAGYTYGPLLGLYIFGLFSTLKVRDNLVLYVCLAAPLVTWLLDLTMKKWFDVGFLTIFINGLITLLGLWAISYRDYDRK